MANLRESPNGNNLGQQGKVWFEELFPNPPQNIERSIVFGKQHLQEIANQPGCLEFVFSKRPAQNRPTLAAAGVDGGPNLLAGNGHLLFISTHFQFPRPADAPVNRDNFRLNQVQRTQGVTTLNFEIPESTSQVLDNLIDRFRSFSAEPDANFFLTVKFTKTDLQHMLDNPNCARIAFVPVFIKCNEEAVINRNGVRVTEHSSSFLETLAAMPLTGADDLILPDANHPIPISTEAWPKPWPPYL